MSKIEWTDKTWNPVTGCTKVSQGCKNCYAERMYEIAVYDNDSEISVRIKEFMVIYNLVDIKMRMLRVLELLKIQGFPEEYNLEGNQSDQKKFIGNSVHPLVVKYWAEALAAKIIYTNSKKKVA